MAEPVTPQLVEARLRDFGLTTVNQTVSLFKGGTFALAAVLLLEIVVQPEGRELRLLLWCASFVLAVTSYTAHLNNAVVNFRETVGAVVMVIVQQMAELLLFVILTSRYADQAWRGWAFVYAVFMIATGARMLMFRVSGVPIAPELQPLIATVEKNRRGGAIRTLRIGAVALIAAIPVAILPAASPWPAWITMVFAAFGMFTSALALHRMHRQRLLMEQLLQKAEMSA
jgi:hypothetical protein